MQQLPNGGQQEEKGQGAGSKGENRDGELQTPPQSSAPQEPGFHVSPRSVGGNSSVPLLPAPFPPASSGVMVSLIASEAQVRQIIAPFANTVSIAAINSPESIVISGASEDIATICQKLAAQKVKTKYLEVSHAFHSPLMTPMLSAFEQVANQITYYQPQIPIISNVTGQLADEQISTAKYWVNHIQQTVQFAQGMETLAQQGYEVFLEIGAKPTLLGMGRECLPDSASLWLPSLRPGMPEWKQLLESLADLYVAGIEIDWLAFAGDAPQQKVPLPNYPFQRQRYWLDTPSPQPKTESVSVEQSQTPITKLLNQGNTQDLVQLLQQAGNFSPEHLQLLPEILAVLVKEHQQHLIPENIRDFCYEIVWRNQGNIQSIRPNNTELGSCLIFADRQGIGQELAGLWRQQKPCTLVYPGTEYKKIRDQEIIINPALPEDFQRLFREHTATNQAPCQKVIYLWNLDTIAANALSLNDLETASQLVCGGVLSLLQSLINQGFSRPPSLWLVTKGAQPVKGESTLSGLAQATVWGLGKVITNEHPEFNCTLVDLDPDGKYNTQHLWAEICSHQPNSSENRLAFRHGQRYVNRIARKQEIVKQSLEIKTDATYLITGGLGEIGLLIAKWLVEHGAKHLVLVGRSHPQAAVQATLTQLEAAKCQVVIMQADVSLEEDVASLLAQIQTSMPPLKGIIHAAGVIEDRLLVEHQWSLFAKVFAPKVSGAWNLHHLTQDLPLDFFVLFSSIASIMGFAGTANYTAANTFLDAIAHYRRSLNLPGLSINWGPWSKLGMAKTVEMKTEAQWANQGIQPMEPQQLLSILENLLPQNTAQIGVMQLDWSKFLAQFSGDSSPSFVAEIAQQLQTPAITQKQQPAKILDQIKESSPEQSQALLIDYLSQQMAKALGITTSKLSIDQPLNKMGLDSLMVVELKNRLRSELGINIPITKFLDGVSVIGLTKLIAQELFAVQPVSQTSVVPTITARKNSRVRGEL
ncbi:SDR family NAD(P)-dependent oxidoreductase [Nostoc sp. FACHB-110]|nr:SDR family NAD(P)-dependent oxidoreductase [Nostoc sp. FACHB-110]